MDSRQNVIEDFHSIIETIRKVKGEDYASALKCCSNVTNILALHIVLLDSAIAGSGKSTDFLNTVSSNIAVETCAVFIRLLTKGMAPEKADQLAVDFGRDITSLSRRQDSVTGL